MKTIKDKPRRVRQNAKENFSRDWTVRHWFRKQIILRDQTRKLNSTFSFPLVISSLQRRLPSSNPHVVHTVAVHTPSSSSAYDSEVLKYFVFNYLSRTIEQVMILWRFAQTCGINVLLRSSASYLLAATQEKERHSRSACLSNLCIYRLSNSVWKSEGRSPLLLLTNQLPKASLWLTWASSL
jgi:hypothetical protein